MTSPSIYHVAEDMDVLAGGVPAVVRQLTRRLVPVGHKTTVTYCLGDASDLDDVASTVRFPPNGLLRPWSHSPNLYQAFSKVLTSHNDESIVHHIHGIWKAPQILAAKACLNASSPFLFSAHGMLEPWLWNRQGFSKYLKKNLFWSMLARKYIHKSTIIHAATSLERDHLYSLLPGSKIVIIPNAIELSASRELPSRRSRKKNFLFLGRIEPKKGVDILINAFAHSSLAPEWSLDIVGPSWSDSYLSSLHKLVYKHSLNANIKFHGPLIGDAKSAFLRTSWAMVTPSHSEVVGLVNLEAADYFLPSITTHQTGLSDWSEGGGILSFPDVLSISRALTEASSWSSDEQFERGVASRLLVHKRYSWDHVTPLWHNLYNQLSS